MRNTDSSSKSFHPNLFEFLRELKQNNNREWFHANKERYESIVRHPAQQFISDFGPRLGKISEQFSADPRPVGGSLFRIHRDVRFSRDKSPYKTSVGIQFRHKKAKDVHSPGFYLHLEPGSVFAGIGMWHPDSASLKMIRNAIVNDPRRWKRVLAGKRFSSLYELAGDRLKRPPRGYDAEHPLLEDLKRKDFLAVAKLTQKQVTSSGFLDEYAALCRASTPFMKLLCEAVGVSF
jgi:uncharacterized protein (TIGR02453 family)